MRTTQEREAQKYGFTGNHQRFRPDGRRTHTGDIVALATEEPGACTGRFVCRHGEPARS